MTPWQVGPDDTAAHGDILTLLHWAFAFMEGCIDPPSSLHRLSADDIAAQAHWGEVWVVGAPIAACVFLSPKPDRLYLGKLAVAQAARGRGHARALIDLAGRRAWALGLPVLELETRIELAETHAAFARLGFESTQKTCHAGYARPTGLVMQKRVG